MASAIDIRRTFVGSPSDVLWTSVGRPLDVPSTSTGRPLVVRRTSVGRPSDVRFQGTVPSDNIFDFKTDNDLALTTVFSLLEGDYFG